MHCQQPDAAVCSLTAAQEAYFVAGEKDVAVSQEAFRQDIGECVVFFIEVEDACIGCTYRHRSDPARHD